MKSVKIKGNDYVMVNERISYFRTAEEYKDWSLVSEIISIDNDGCTIKALVIDDKGIIRATGHAQEDRTSTIINKTSYIENCETSAWGRALGCLGIGIKDSIASAEEVEMAIKKQEMANVSHETQKTQSEVCEDCYEPVQQNVAQYSNKIYGKCLCRTCQKNHKPKEVNL